MQNLLSTKKRLAILSAFILLALAALAAGTTIRAYFIKFNAPKQFAELTRQDPLFWDNSLDPAAVEKELERLERAGNELTSLARQYGNRDERVLFWPLNFLKTLPETGRRAAMVIENPTPQNIRNLLAQYLKNIRLYKQELEIFKNAAEERMNVIATSDEVTLKERNIVPGGYEYDISKFIALAEKNAAALEAEILRRERCAKTGFECEIAFVMPAIPPPESPLPLLSRDMALPNPSGLKQNSWGPVFVPSNCWSPKRNWYSVYLIEAEPPHVPGATRTYIKLADENLYRIVRDEKTLEKLITEGPTDAVAGHDIIERPHLKQGLPLELISEGRFRRCSDFGHYPRTATLLWLMDELNATGRLTKEISGRGDSSETKEALQNAKAAEAKLINAKVPSWHDAREFALSLQKILALAAENKVAIPQDYLERMIRMQSGVSTALPRFNVVLRALGDDLEYYSIFAWKETRALLPKQLVWETSYWSILYFPFSSAFWRISEQPSFTRTYASVFEATISADRFDELRRMTYRQTVLFSQIRALFDLPEITLIGERSRAIKDELARQAVKQ